MRYRWVFFHSFVKKAALLFNLSNCIMYSNCRKQIFKYLSFDLSNYTVYRQCNKTANTFKYNTSFINMYTFK